MFNEFMQQHSWCVIINISLYQQKVDIYEYNYTVIEMLKLNSCMLLIPIC